VRVFKRAGRIHNGARRCAERPGYNLAYELHHDTSEYEVHAPSNKLSSTSIILQHFRIQAPVWIKVRDTFDRWLTVNCD
jgi:hypothetical protein